MTSSAGRVILSMRCTRRASGLPRALAPSHTGRTRNRTLLLRARNNISRGLRCGPTQCRVRSPHALNMLVAPCSCRKIISFNSFSPSPSKTTNRRTKPLPQDHGDMDGMPCFFRSGTKHNQREGLNVQVCPMHHCIIVASMRVIHGVSSLGLRILTRHHAFSVACQAHIITLAVSGDCAHAAASLMLPYFQSVTRHNHGPSLVSRRDDGLCMLDRELCYPLFSASRRDGLSLALTAFRHAEQSRDFCGPHF